MEWEKLIIGAMKHVVYEYDVISPQGLLTLLASNQPGSDLYSAHVLYVPLSSCHISTTLIPVVPFHVSINFCLKITFNLKFRHNISRSNELYY